MNAKTGASFSNPRLRVLFALSLVVSLVTVVPAGPFLSTTLFFDTKAAHAQPASGSQESVVFTSLRDGGNGEIYVMNADGRGQKDISNSPAYDDYPSWSPDGTKIVFYTNENSIQGLAVMNTDGTNPKSLTTAPDAHPDWSPSGTKIAFSGRTPGHEIFVMNADGSGVTDLTNNPSAADMHPSWSPDGTKIAFDSNRGGINVDFEIYVMNANGGGVRFLTNNNNHQDTTPSWSPDGTKIAFSSTRDAEPGTNNQEIYVMNAVDGSGVKRLTNNVGIDTSPSWSPDGTKIAFQSDRDGNEEIYVMNAVDGSGQTNISNNPADDTEPDFAPGDLSITSVTAVQAPDNPTTLVAGKKTLLKATIENTFPKTNDQALSVDIKLTSGPVTGEPTYEEFILNYPLEPGKHDYYLPRNDFLLPEKMDFLTASVEVDPPDSNNPSGKIKESDENNNSLPINSLPVVKTKNLRILYVPVRFTGDSVQNSPTCDQVNAIKEGSEKFIDAVYPVADSLHIVDCSYRPFDMSPPPGSTLTGAQLSTLYNSLEQLTWCARECRLAPDGASFDRIIGVVRQNWHLDFLGRNSAGESLYSAGNTPSPPVSFVQFQYVSGAPTAHEVGHTFDVEHNAGSAPGYWVQERRSTADFPLGSSTQDFMHPTTSSATTVDRWTSKDTFNTLVTRLRMAGDPAVIGVTGIISKDGSVEFDPLKRFDDIVDLPLDNFGEYTLSYVDSGSNTLAETSFDVSFTTTAHEGNPEIDAAPFALRIPDVEGTEKMVLKKGDQVLAESTFEGGSGDDTSPPVIAVPADMTAEATSAQGAIVTFEVNATDNVDGNATLGTDGTIITQDDIGGDIAISCTPASGSTFPIGDTTAECTATDAAGNTVATPASFTITVTQPADTTAPETVIDSIKDGDGNVVSGGDTVQSDAIEFAFSSPDADVSKFQCSIDGAAWEDNCTSPKSYSGLSEVTHTFSVIAVDTAGNSDQTPATFEWTVTQSGGGTSTYVIEGFYPPIDAPPTFNVVNSGRTLPFKFNVYEEVSPSAGATTTRTEIKDTSIAKSFEVVRDVSRTECNNADVDAAEETTTTSTSLIYDTQEGQFIQHWKLTPRTSYPSNSCWTAILTVGDDIATATKEALIKIR